MATTAMLFPTATATASTASTITVIATGVGGSVFVPTTSAQLNPWASVAGSTTPPWWQPAGLSTLSTAPVLAEIKDSGPLPKADWEVAEFMWKLDPVRDTETV